MNNRLSYLVTGASSGIGYELCRQLASEGHTVYSISRRGFPDIVEFPNVIDIKCDLSDPDSLSLILKVVEQNTNELHGVILNAGILQIKDLISTTLHDWDVTFDLNVKASFFLVQRMLPLLIAQGNARIVIVSSNAGRMGGISNSIQYATSKGALISMTYALAQNLARYKICVNCVAPGPTNTEMFNSYELEKINQIKEKIPLKRLGNVKEVVGSIRYFLSDEAGFTTGAVLDVNGGIFMG